MPIQFFDTLRPVLEEHVQFAANEQQVDTAVVHQQILVEAANNQAEWYSDRVPNLNYHQPACRLAYMYIVAAANANTFKHILANDAGLRDYVLGLAAQCRRIRVCAFGAGPGTELLGFAKFLDQQQLGYCVQVDFQLLDRVEEWQNSWFGLRDQIHRNLMVEYGADFARWPILPSGNFLCQDVTNTQRMRNLGNVWNQDLYVMNFLLSEVFEDSQPLCDFMAAVSQRAPRGSRFVFIERRGGRWQYRMSRIATQAGLQLGGFIESRSPVLDVGENPNALGQIYQVLSQAPGNDRRPRQSWNVVYAVGERV